MEIKLEDLKVLFSEEQLQTRIKELADEMNEFYNGEEVIAICVLKGAVMFAVVHSRQQTYHQHQTRNNQVQHQLFGSSFYLKENRTLMI